MACSRPRTQQRQARLSLRLSACCAATLLLNPSSVDAFSLVQNAAASSQSSSLDGDGGPASSAAPGGSSRPSVRPSASASAAASNPFRGSLNSRQGRRRKQKGRSGDDFALRMGAQSEMVTEKESHREADAGGPSEGCQSDGDPSASASASADDEEQIYQRRAFLSGMLATTAAAITAASSPLDPAEPADAYEQAYPLELQSTPYNEVETSSNSLSKLKQERIDDKKAKVEATRTELRNDPLGFNSPSSNFGVTMAGASTWALALWFATGSRSNPIVTLLANVLYDEKEEEWLSDRNDGYFAELPLGFTAILSAVFVFLGVILDRAVYFLADGDNEISLQLAGVSVIGGAVWEVGRLAAKEKAPTREEYERDALLYREFEEFAGKRIVVGRGSCHRSDVIGAFRRYNPKYRVADNERYPLADVEVERMLRAWNRQFGSGSEMSSAGFFSGISVDDAADAFAPR